MGISFGVQACMYFVQNHWITYEQNIWGYVWPPSQLADFVIGVAAAAVAKRQEVDAFIAECYRGILADISVMIVMVVSLCSPYGGGRVGWEPLFNHGFALLLASFLYGSAAQGGAGLVAKFLRHDALTSLGAFSFEVYL